MSEYNNITKLVNILIDVFLVIVIICGFFGNFLCFKIFNSTRLNKYPISLYFRIISIFDSLVLLEAANYFIDFNFGFYIGDLNDFLCKIDYYLSYVSSPISPWIMVVVSIDRFVNSAFPKRFPILHKFKVQLAISLSIVICNFILYSFLLWNSALVESNFKKIIF